MQGFCIYKNTCMKYETFAPLFPGFYNTHFEYDGEDQDIEYYNEQNGTEYGYDAFKFDYRDYETRIGKAFIERLERELNVFLPVKLEFQCIYSPKFYNFSTDSIHIIADLDLSKLLELIQARYKDAAIYFKDTYTSCSGFISSYSNDINDWLNPAYILKKPEHCIGALLNCLSWCEIDTDSITYWCDHENWINHEPLEPA